MCAATVTTVLACAVDEKPPAESQTSSEASICTTRNAGDPWWYWSSPTQSGRFHAFFQATPGANNIDAVVGLSKGVATTWSQLAVIVRFAPNGVLDVRDGGAYAADANIPYFANTTYYFRIDVDVPSHTYSVRVSTDPNATYAVLATNYAFRTEQSSLTSIDSGAAYVDTTAPGSIEICDVGIVADDTSPDGCVTSTAGGGFANAWIDSVQSAYVAQFTATPSESNIDGVVGYSAGEADAYSDYVASVRFSTEGVIEARDGDAYRATNAMPYVAGHTYRFYVVVDMASATYSVYASDGYDTSSYTPIADGFAFRPSQVGVTLINNVATVVDSPTGQVRACAFRTTSPYELRFARNGSANRLVAFRDGRVLSVSYGHVDVLDNAGKTLASAELSASWAAVGPNDDVYLVSDDWNAQTMTVQALTSALEPQWTQTFAASYGVNNVGVYDTGDIAIARNNTGGVIAEIVNLHPDGRVASHVDVSASGAWSIGFGRDRFALGSRIDDSVFLEMHAPDGALLWNRTWSGDASVGEIAVEPSGSVVFGGSFGGDGIDFGAGHWDPVYSSEVRLNGYIVALSIDGALRFANRLYVDEPTSLSSSGDRIAYATTQWSQIPHPQLFVYGRAGDLVRGGTLSLIDDAAGSLGPAVVTSEGLTVVDVNLKLHPSNAIPMWPFLMSFVY